MLKKLKILLRSDNINSFERDSELIERVNALIDKVNEIDERTRVRPPLDLSTVKWVCGEEKEEEGEEIDVS